jgi:ring-1,2-phenylacetyl-CoA epoxidase subunit PaaE
MAPYFNTLKIRDVRRETADAVSIAFDVPVELAEQYQFAPGEYLTLRQTIRGRDVRRCYSISSGLDDYELRVTIKKVANGLFSSFASDDLRPGLSIDVMTPMGGFTAPIEPDKGKVYVAFAARWALGLLACVDR